MMIKGAFQHRSGRVISLGRLVLASVFLLAIWLDPSQPTRAPAEGYAILAAYVLLSAALLAATWNDWWLERRSAAPAHIVDVGVFTAMVFLTEGYTSPFFTFFVFLILSSTIRWSWRETALTAITVIVLFILAGVASIHLGGTEFDLRRLIIRSAYLVVLSLILIWFGVNQEGSRSNQMRQLALEGDIGRDQAMIRQALDYAASRIGARRLIFAWWDKEEPWINVGQLEHGRYEANRFGPDELGVITAPSLAGQPFLFDRHQDRFLAGRRMRFKSEPIGALFAERFKLYEGLVIPVETTDHGGLIVAEGVPGLCADDLAIAERLGAEVSAALQRALLLRISEDAAVTRTRLSLARDLHDSVIQLLAGTSFRLEAIRRKAGEGRDTDVDIAALQTELAQEQRDLRQFISKLRGDATHSRMVALEVGLAALAERMARQWGIICRLTPPDGSVLAPARLEHDIHQLVREGVANAVRHGGAGEVRLGLQEIGGTARLEIADDGRGFPASGEDPSPWSLSERVRELGGRLSLQSAGTGSRVAITLPLDSRV
jgi:signal transduction histidine kinase